MFEVWDIIKDFNLFMSTLFTDILGVITTFIAVLVITAASPIVSVVFLYTLTNKIKDFITPFQNFSLFIL